MKKLTKKEMKQIQGGLLSNGGACCSVTCADGSSKERECGDKTLCTTSGTKVCCGSGDCIDVCG
jgi:bacteriocin-like protein